MSVSYCFLPEDHGGCRNSGPTSIWALQEFRSLEGLQCGRRGAEYLSARLENPTTGNLLVFSHFFAEVCKSLHFGWPELVATVVDHDTTMSYEGPLQKYMPMCTKTQGTERTSSDGLFLSQSATGLSSKFWKQCFSGLETANALTEMCRNSVSQSTELPQQEGCHLLPQPFHHSVFSVYTSKGPFSQCENQQNLQGIHIQVKSEYVGTIDNK